MFLCVDNAILELAAEQLLSQHKDNIKETNRVMTKVQFVEYLVNLTPEGKKRYFELMGK